jgi:hypothetical protein
MQDRARRPEVVVIACRVIVSGDRGIRIDRPISACPGGLGETNDER